MLGTRSPPSQVVLFSPRNASPRPPVGLHSVAVAGVPPSRAVRHEISYVVVTTVGHGAAEVIAVPHPVPEKMDRLR